MSGEEEWARRIIQEVLGRSVERNDDNSSDGMYDLRIGSADAPEVAIECVGAVNPQFTETWNVGPAKGPLQFSIKGDWSITITPASCINSIKRHVERILQQLEGRGIDDICVNHLLKRNDEKLFNELESLGIEQASCYRLQGTGKVHLATTGQGGAVDELGSKLPAWLGEFLDPTKKKDVVLKLKRSGAAECHVFVTVGFSGANWAVESYLAGDIKYIPTEPPDLPEPITGVWVILDGGHRGLYWIGSEWKVFSA